jgi:two-component system KDP operon response regulator KdpE
MNRSARSAVESAAGEAPAAAPGNPALARVVVASDDPRLLQVIRADLVARGYGAEVAAPGEAALEAVTRHDPDLLVLDLGLQGIDGFELMRRVRRRSGAPVVVLSARGEEREKVRALDLGADDYLTQPFGMGELLARIRVALRRSGGPAAPAVVRTEDFEFDPGRRRLQVRGSEVRLSPTEYELLRYFAAYADHVLPYRWLLQHVWGPRHGEKAHYLHVYVAGLRKKLEPDPRHPRYLRTEPRVGYRFEAGPAAPEGSDPAGRSPRPRAPLGPAGGQDGERRDGEEHREGHRAVAQPVPQGSELVARPISGATPV